MILNESEEVLNYFKDYDYLLAHKSRAGQYYTLRNKCIEIDKKDIIGVNPIMMAVLHNSYQLVECLLIHGANVHNKFLENKTLLHYAVIMQNPRIVKLLLDFSFYIKTNQASIQG